MLKVLMNFDCSIFRACYYSVFLSALVDIFGFKYVIYGHWLFEILLGNGFNFTFLLVCVEISENCSHYKALRSRV